MIKGLYWFATQWSSKGSVWIISDTHFNDSDCHLMDPAWISPEKQLMILKRYIHKNDTLIHLGDVGDPEFIGRIPGHKVLILGNHDFTVSKFRPYFDEIYEGPLVISKKIILSHEPVDVPWAFNIHGHDHNAANRGDDFHLNLAANVCGYTPISLGLLINSGKIAGIRNIHRMTIDKASGGQMAENGKNVN